LRGGVPGRGRRPDGGTGGLVSAQAGCDVVITGSDSSEPAGDFVGD
jgi:hypothetical protein